WVRGGAAWPDADMTAPQEAVTAQRLRPRFARPGPPRRARRNPLAAQRHRAGLIFSLPVVVLVSTLLLIPIGQTVYYSFTNWDGFTSQWIGFAAYGRLFSNPQFVTVLENNAALVIAVPIAIALPLGVAFLINTHVRGWRFFRSVFFLPTAVSWVVIAFVARRFFDPDKQGILQSLLNHTGLGFLHPNLLAHEHSALAAVMITFVWSVFGTNMIIFLAGMATIDQEIYDAAKVDGAGPFTVMRRITFPLLKRFVQFAFIISLITAFSALFSLIVVMTNGGPGYGTTTLEFFIYEQAFTENNFGVGATAGVVLFLLVFAVSMVQLRLLRSDD
ncbi:MAG: carbohydrate ABC transporter permease, partial [Gaiellaceae bacterium]